MLTILKSNSAAYSLLQQAVGAPLPTNPPQCTSLRRRTRTTTIGAASRRPSWSTAAVAGCCHRRAPKPPMLQACPPVAMSRILHCYNRPTTSDCRCCERMSTVATGYSKSYDRRWWCCDAAVNMGGATARSDAGDQPLCCRRSPLLQSRTADAGSEDGQICERQRRKLRPVRAVLQTWAVLMRGATLAIRFL